MSQTIQEVTKQRDELQEKLDRISSWARKDMKSSINSIARQRASNLDKNTHDNFYQEETAADIENKITEYFGNILLMNAPS